MTYEEAKQQYLDRREKSNAIGLGFYLNSLDVETGVAPSESFAYRSKQLEVLSGMIYDMTTSPEAMESIRVLAENETDDQALLHEVRLAAEQAEKLAKIPKEEYLAFNALLNEVYPVYVTAKQTSDFALFEPYLQRIFDYNRKYVNWVGGEKQGYDVLLDEFERDYGQKEYDEFFALLKEAIVPLVKEISGKKLQFNDSFLQYEYDVERQKEFCEYLREVCCFDRERTVMLESEHPFTTNNGSHDVRITNHFYTDNLSSSIFSAIHEMGHGLYELQVADEFEGTGSGGGASLAMHESQSRLMENMIGRSLPFWNAHFPKLKSIFPKELEGVTAEDFYKYVNRVEESLVRTEADELTYSIHVLIRYEIERAVMEGKVEAKDIPALWNRKYKEYLNVDVPCDKEGCLQDSHWSGGSLGYFPTYSLGSAYAAQIYRAMERDLNMDAVLGGKNLRPLADWLKEHLHRYGASKFPKELIRIATGEEFSPRYYVEYLTEKYRTLYGI